jgi:hypothetical protein
MQKKLLFLSFIEGAAVMAAELCGAKLLAPIFGSSLYVWASVMGITLAALASGYFFGGWITAKAKEPYKKLFQVLGTAALFLLLMPVLSYYLVPRISYLPFLPGMVISTTLLLFLPVFFLGASSPLFISVQATDIRSAGMVSGTVYAVSTAGGISATFLCGFYLIPEVGLSACLLSFGGLLFITNIIVFKFFKPLQLLLCAAFVYLNVQFSFKKTGQLISSDSVLGHLEVEDLVNTNHEPIRILKINNIIQTEMNLKTRLSLSDYVALLDTLIPFSATHENALVLGLGGGLTANLLAQKHYITEGVELDNRIIAAAKDYFYLARQVRTVYADARYFLNTCTAHYAVVLVDVFKAEEQPSHILTLESLTRLKKNLTPSARLLINWHGYSTGEKGRGTAILYRTLVAAGFHVSVCSMSDSEDQRNLIFVASVNPLNTLPFQLDETFATTGPVNTDDLPLLEKYNARANKTWRTNYLRYYQHLEN